MQMQMQGMQIQARAVRDGPRRLALLWRNSFASPTAAVRRHQFSLRAEGLDCVHRIRVVRAVLFFADANSLVHERSLLALTVNGFRNTVALVSDPAVQGGQEQKATVSCILPATGDLGIGSYSFTYADTANPAGTVVLESERGVGLADVQLTLETPLFPALDWAKVLQCYVELLVE